jgi:hypothetical protein
LRLDAAGGICGCSIFRGTGGFLYPLLQARGAELSLAEGGASPQKGQPTVKKILELPAPGRTRAVTWSPDGSKLAAFSFIAPGRILNTYLESPFGSVIMVWRADGTLIRQLSRPAPFFGILETFAFTADGTEIVAPPLEASSDKAFSVFKIETGEIVREVAQTEVADQRRDFRLSMIAAS